MAKIKKSYKKASARLKKTSPNQKSKKKSTTKKSRKPVSRILKKDVARKKPVKPAKKRAPKKDKETISDKQLLSVAASAKDAIIMIDSSGAVSYWNPEAEKIFGYKLKEVVGKKLHEYIIPEKYRKAHLKSLANFRKTGKGDVIGKTVELEGLRKNGEEFPLELSLSSFKQDGRWYATGIIRDITYRKLLEEAVSTSEEQFRLLIEHSPDCICYISLDGKYLYMSPAGLRLNELKGMDKIRGQYCTENINAEFKDTIRNALERAECGETVSLEYASTTSSGKEIWWESLINPVKDGNGNVIKLIRFSKDITERKKAEDALSNALKETQTIIDTNPDIFYTYNLEGRLIKWNKGLEDLTGLTPQELMLRSAVEFVCEEDRPHVIERMKEVFEKGKSTVEAYFLSKDGSLVPYLCNGTILQNDKGDVVGFTGSGRDITKRKAFENALRNIATSVSTGRGGDFFCDMVFYLGRTLGVDYAFIGELVKEEPEKVKVISMCASGELSEPFEYDLKDTPCEQVTQEGICSFPSGVASKFPKDTMLLEMGIESYVGAPIRDKTGKTLGLIVLLNSRPLTNQEIAESTLAVCADRVASELNRKQAEEEIRSLLNEVTAYKERMESELKFAELVQKQLLPSNESLKDFKGCNIASHYMASSTIGGDLYDVLEYDENKVAFMLADVTGHGPSAAMIMAIVKGLVSSETYDYPSPYKLARRLNRKLLAMLPEGYFITLFFAVADLKKKTLTYVTAGHPPALMVGKRFDSPLILESNGPLVGIIEQKDFDVKEDIINFHPGDKLVFFSDGIFEVQNSNGKQYGFNSFKNLVFSQSDSSVNQLVDNTLAEINNFLDPKQEIDDIAIVAVEFT